MLLPLYFLIGMWGGIKREYAAIKFFLYTLFGSVFMLLVIIGLYFSVINPATGNHTFNMILMMDPSNYSDGSIFSAIAAKNLFGISARLLAFIVLFVAFAIKVPIVPLHTWLPDAHVEAPTPISIILAGLLYDQSLLQHFSRLSNVICLVDWSYRHRLHYLWCIECACSNRS
jgi:NADH-quinone oxidoreductase subunit M